MSGSAPAVLVVDDEIQIRRLLTAALSSRGYQVTPAANGQQALHLLSTSVFDLVLLDLGLPDLDGVEVCRRVREWSRIPIIVVTVRDDEREKVAALDNGADDYVTKPFGIDELLARIRANLRRSTTEIDEPTLHFGSLTIDLGRRTVQRGEQRVHLTPTEYELLRVLALHGGRVLTHRQLLREARGPAYEGETPLLRVHMVGLRQKLGITAQRAGFILTEPGVGYRLLTEDAIPNLNTI